jgi:hypothetical protein
VLPIDEPVNTFTIDRLVARRVIIAARLQVKGGLVSRSASHKRIVGFIVRFPGSFKGVRLRPGWGGVNFACDRMAFPANAGREEHFWRLSSTTHVIGQGGGEPGHHCQQRLTRPIETDLNPATGTGPYHRRPVPHSTAISRLECAAED